MKIYTDFDHVLHNYTPSFIRNIEILSGKELKLSTLPANYDLFTWMGGHGISQDIFQTALDLTSSSNEWDPTHFCHALLDYYRSMMEKGHQLIVVTARPFREAVESMMKEKMGADSKIPVISCKSQFKHLVITDGSLIFEDHPLTAIDCAQYFPNSHVFVPIWPWNEHLRFLNFPNLTMLDQEAMATDIAQHVEEALKEFKHAV